jgi:Asp-tRNA(Asn)/Glu-tRNA(Gln) amidotransferase A subunit family amidase
MVASLTAAGAIVVPINESVYNSSALSAAFDVQSLEYRESLDHYLQDPSLRGVHPASFDELYHGHEFLVIPSQYSFINTAMVSSTGNASYFLKQQGIHNLTVALASTFKADSLDALIYPEQQNLVVKVGSPSQYGRNGILGALTGSPVVTVPAGFSAPTREAPIGVPIGMEILGLPWTEPALLNIAAHIADLKKVRRMPTLTEKPVSVRVYKSMPKIVPNTHNIAQVYPIGVL